MVSVCGWKIGWVWMFFWFLLVRVGDGGQVGKGGEVGERRRLRRRWVRRRIY